MLLIPILMSLTREGFEPSHPKITQLECVALDHSAIPSLVGYNELWVFYGALPTELTGLAPRAGLEPATPGLKGYERMLLSVR